MTSTRLLARNTVLNIVGQVIPMLAAVVAIPILLRHLGDARFGVLTLAWAAIGYFNLFDLGLGRALTHAVAARLGSPNETSDLSDVAWTALSLMLVLGAVGGLLLAALTPAIVQRALNTPPSLVREAIAVFYLLACSLPFVITTAGLRGLLEAHQEFGAVTALRLPLALFTFIGPLAVLPFSASLVPIVTILLVGRVLTWVAHLAVCLRRRDYLRRPTRPRATVVRPLLTFGGWMTLSNVVSPVMAYMDRFLIGAILPLAAVTYYVTPYELVTKLLVLPQAMVVALFPAFAYTYVTDPGRTGALLERALRAAFLALFPLLLTVVVFAREGLTLWVGPAIAAQSAGVLQWLAVGVFLNGVAQAPFVVLQSTGRPDVTAKLHLVELPLYLAGLWWLAHRFGVTGVAMAWTLRAAVDAAALLALASRRVPSGPRPVLGLATLAIVVLTAVLGLAALPAELGLRTALLGATLAVFAVLGWTRVVRPSEREGLVRWAHERSSFRGERADAAHRGVMDIE